jgi:predicted Zn-dependent protease
MIRLLVLVCTFSLLTACATSPTGRTQFMVFSEETAIASSKQAYSEMLNPLAKEGKINTDALLLDRVKGIASRIVAQAVILRPETKAWDWEIKIIDDPKTVNAWAMAGGKMALYNGLVDQLKPSDDELAQVIGHEIAHALAKHSAEKMSIAAATQVGVTAVGVVSDHPEIAMTGASLLAALALTLPNSRTMESEADRIGIELAAKAGYDPAAAITLWDKMAKLGGGAPPQFLSTHPSPANRQQALSALVPEMKPYYEAKVDRPSYPL